MSVARPGPGYVPREPAQTTLHRVVREGLGGFLEAHPHLPAFIERELRAFIACADPEAGFARLHCHDCGHDHLLPFSCKKPSVCPSCAGRRMNETAAWWTAALLPHTRHRQWVLTLPFALRAAVAFDHKLCTVVLQAYTRAIFAELKRRARARGVRGGRCGSVTAIHRTTSALTLSPHYHLITPDAVFVPVGDDAVELHELPPPTQDELERTLTAVRRRVARAVTRYIENNPTELAWLDDAARARLTGLAVRNLQPDGTKPDRIVDPAAARAASPPPLCAEAEGFSLHANTSTGPLQRGALEDLARYILHPALPQNRLAERPDGRLELQLARPSGDGTTAVVLTRDALIARLCTLITPPYANAVRYHGVYASRAKLRPAVLALCQPASR